jgi:hypothetical protein
LKKNENDHMVKDWMASSTVIDTTDAGNDGDAAVFGEDLEFSTDEAP